MATVGISETSSEYNTLFYNSDNEYINYWVADKYIGGFGSGYAEYGLHSVGGAYLICTNIYASSGFTGSNDNSREIRAIISMHPNIEFTGAGNGTTNESPYIYK